MSMRRRLHRPLSWWAATLVAVTVVDLVFVGLAGARGDKRPSLIVPYGTTAVPTALTPGIDPYAHDPGAFGLTREVERPAGSWDSAFSGPDDKLRYAILALMQGETRHVALATRAVEEVLDQAESGIVRHREPARDTDGNRLPAGWVSAETQGLLLSALSRLYDQTGKKRWRQEANRVFATLLRFQGGRDKYDRPFEPWLSFVDQYGFLWFERYPQSMRPSLTMTSQGTVLFGIYDYSRIAPPARQEVARLAFSRGAGPVLQFTEQLPQRNAPAWTSYWKVSRSFQRHQQLVAQLHTLAKITGVTAFDDLADVLAVGGSAYRRTLRESRSNPLLQADDARRKADRLFREYAG